MSTSSTRKRTVTYSLSADEAYAVQSCEHCRLQFDRDARTPRVLHCGHTFCTACLSARIRQESARKWCVACPVDGEETSVPKGDAAKLGTNHALVAELARMVVAGPDLYRVHIKNLAGDSWPLVVTADTTIGDLKQRIYEVRAKCAVHLQRLMVRGAGDEYNVLENDAATLGALGIGGECVVLVVVRDGLCGVDDALKFGAAGDGNAQFNFPWGVCVSGNADLLFVTDFHNNRVQVLRASDGAHVLTIDALANGDGARHLQNPSCVCISSDGLLLFVSDLSHRVHVFRVADGAHVRAIGAMGSDAGQLLYPRGVCLSPDNERLYVADCDNCRVQVYRAADGAHVRAIDLGAGQMRSPMCCCVSADGQYLFVSGRGGGIQVFRTDNGTHVRRVGGDLVQCAFGVQLSLCGSLLFVADDEGHCVRVFEVESGAYQFTIAIPRHAVVGAGATAASRLSRPRGISWARTAAGQEQLFVADSTACCIHRFSASY